MRSDSKELSLTSSSSSVFKQLQFNYLIGYALAATGNCLQSSYRYAIFDSYDLRRTTIERIFLCAHISTLTLGTLTSSLSDKYGRRTACILSAIFYIISCLSLNMKVVWIFFVGSAARGIAHSLYNTNFEAWLIHDHHNSGLSTDLLKEILRNSFVLSSIVAIGTGFVSELSAELLGYVAPFDIAIGIYLIMIIFILIQWRENYGDKEASSTTSFIHSIEILRNDPRILLVGLITSLFEVTIYIYAMEWTPALERASIWIIHEPLPLGIIYSSFMFFNMIGTIVFKPLSQRFRVQSFMLVIFLLTALSYCMLVIVPDVQPVVLGSFCLYEFCVGIYLPSISLLRSQYLPDSVRATLMNYFRIPRVVLMVIIIVWDLPLALIFTFCSIMSIMAFVCLLILRSMKPPEEYFEPSETVVLLPPTPSYDLKVKQPQITS
ncbi:unnamed protein product [Adineta steineri]|uniref:Major facilitator superfamily (MFS) profile domain-containing protein n=1 Tax=Adineta steineri TaxID=433720 RepID=A0A816D294_9BILA|nr:unnamed protein product [Adineta steineri]CAF1628767.1 unnamed protein product [Adineta steineri]